MGLIAWMAVCYVFLYAPIAFLIVFSFNEARLVTAWTAFSTHWYSVLWHDQMLIDATLLSLRIAAVSATIACLVGGSQVLYWRALGNSAAEACFKWR